MSGYPSKKLKKELNQIGNEIDDLFPKKNKSISTIHVSNVQCFPGFYITIITNISSDSNL